MHTFLNIVATLGLLFIFVGVFFLVSSVNGLLNTLKRHETTLATQQEQIEVIMAFLGISGPEPTK